MDLTQAILERHAVRTYLDKRIEEEKVKKLQSFIDECNTAGDLHIQLVLNEPKAFDSSMAHFGKFSGVQNYIALIGKKTDDLQEKIGYYGAKIILFAQTLELNTCWVALTYKKIKNVLLLNDREKLCSILTLGYGKTQGVAHKSKALEDVCSCSVKPMPEWFLNGVKTALLAPTAINQQKFHFALNSDDTVTATAKSGFYTQMDLGIAKYFFELGAGEKQFRWTN